MLAFLPNVSAQTWQIGTGTATSSNLPIYSCYGYNYSQQLYKNTELTTALGTNNVITKVKFFVSTAPDPQNTYNQWVIYLGNTNKTTFSSNTDWIPLANLTQVYSGTLPPLVAGTWVDIPLSTPFVWNGTDNLVVAVDENTPNYTCTANWGSYTSTANTGIYYYNDSTNPNPASPPTASARTGSIPRIQFDGSVASSCSFPSAVTIGTVTTGTAQVSWTAPTPVPANGYDVYYNSTGVPPTATTVLNASNSVQSTTTNATISGLAGSTTYYAWVRAKCASGQSIWVPSSSFTTLCTAITTLPWTENFDAMTGLGAGILPQCWKNVTGTNPWTSSNAASSSTSPGPRSTPNYVRIQYGNNTASQLWTPGFNLTAGTVYEFSFYYHTGANDSSNMGFTGNVLVNTSQSATGATTLGSFITATQGTAAYTQYKVFFTPTTTATYNFAVNVSSNGTPWYLGVDDFKLRVAPSCLDPQGVSIGVTTLTSTTLQWTVPSPAPANGYDIYYTTTNTPPTATTVPQFSGVSGPSQLITGLTASTTYYIWIRAKCSPTSIGEWTGPYSVYTNYCVPNAGGTSTLYYLNSIATTGGLTNINYTANSYTPYVNNSAQSFSVIPGGSVTANMGVSSGTNYYYVWVDWNNNLSFDPATETVYASTTYQSGATTVISSVGRPSGSYRVRFGSSYIGTTTPCGPNGYGNYVDYTFIIRPCSLNPPTNVNFTAITSTSAQVNWTPAADNLNYKVYWRVAGTATWTNSSAVLTPPAVNYVINGLLPFTNYEVKVVAICGTTEGAAPTYTFTTRCDPTPPTVSVSQITPTSALITWNPLVPNATYELEWKKVTDAVWQTVTTPQPPQNSYLLTGLTSFTKYEVRVRSKCIGSTSANPYSSVQVFTTVRVCEIAPPGLTITQLFPTTAEVTWDAFPGATSYLLQYRKVGIPSWTDVIATTNSYTLTNLMEVTKYEMRVANICNGTPGNFTPLYFFTTPTVTYCAMSGGTSAADFISRVNVAPTGKNVMDNPSAASNYTDFTGIPTAMIELVQGSTNNKITIDRTQSAASGIAVWIDFNRNGYFDINERILAEGPNSNATTTATFTVPTDAFISMSSVKYVVMRVALQKGGVPVNCTNFANGEVEDYSVRISKLPEVNSLNQTDIMIYPNPVKSVLNVRNISAKANYKIYSSSGQLLKSGLILNNKVDVSGLVNGMYVIDIEDVKGTAQKKFIKE